MRDLCPTRSYEVQLLSETDVSKADLILRKHLGANVELQLSKQERVIRFPTSESEQALSELLKSLLQQGLWCRNLEKSWVTLRMHSYHCRGVVE